MNKHDNDPICKRDIGGNAFNAFTTAGLKTYGDVAKLTVPQILRYEGIGRTSIRRVEAFLKSLGYERSDTHMEATAATWNTPEVQAIRRIG